MPADFRKKVSRRYREIYIKITGKKLVKYSDNITARIKKNLKPLSDQVVIIGGSEKDKAWVKKIEAELKKLKLNYIHHLVLVVLNRI